MEQVFNGVELVDGQARLLESCPEECGANLVLLKEMDWLRRANRPTGVDVSFSYTVVDKDDVRANVRPEYTPRFMANSVCGHHMRIADDELKLLLVEVGCVARAQQAVDEFSGTQPGQSVRLAYTGGVSRLRIKPKSVVSARRGTAFAVEDVIFGLEYDCGQRAISECERLYLKFCEEAWIPQQAAKSEHPFYRLKQVAIAQQLVKFLAERGASFSPALFPIDRVPVFFDHCSELVYLAEERRTMVYDCVEPGVGAAALLDFQSAYKGSNIAVLVKKTKKGDCQSYESPEIIYNVDSIGGMHYFGTLVETRPVCPDGGVILSSKVALAESHEATTRLAKRVVGMFVPDEVAYAQTAVSVSKSLGKVVDGAENKDPQMMRDGLTGAFGEVASVVASQITKGVYDKCLLVRDSAVAYGQARSADFLVRVEQLVKGGMTEYDAVEYVLQDEL